MMARRLSLPMYDWPEIEWATDRFVFQLRHSLVENGFKPATGQARPADLYEHWRHPEMLLSQTCGLPYSRFLHPHVGLVGTPSYDIPSSAGQYHSVLIVPAQADTTTLEDLREHRMAINDPGSQSGFAAPMSALMGSSPSLANSLSFITSGSHRASIRCVAEGRADIAAIDAVSWALACRHEPASMSGC